MAPVQLCFIVSKPTTLSKADQKRRRLKALSHAATVSYARRNPAYRDWVQITAASKPGMSAQQRKNSQPSVHSNQSEQDDSPIVMYEQQHAGQACPENDTSPRSQAHRDNASLSPALYKELDPFLKPASPLTRHERNILHHYLLTTPSYVYGTQPGTLYCPVRDMNVPQIQVNRLWLQWTLLYAERSNIPDEESQKAVTLLARRAKIYAYINELISNPAVRYSDSTITGLAFGSLIEWQVGSLDSARRHLGLVRHTLLPERTSMQSLSFFTGFSTYVMLLWVGLGSHAFANWHNLNTVAGKFVRLVSAMQQWTTDLPVYKPKGTKSPALKQKTESSASLRRYWASRNRVFGMSSTLHGFLVPIDPKGGVLSSHQIALLWVVNKMLWELRGDPDMSVEFLEKVYQYIESHDDPLPFGSGASQRNLRPKARG